MMGIEKIKEKKTTEELLEFGILNIDKPSGPTSFDISEFVCKKLSLRKTSHFGTLDPKVTGVLPIALNRACKLTGFFLGEDKEYVGIMRMHENLSLEEIENMINEKFTGKIMQKPPVKSRVARVLREREIMTFNIIEKDEKDILFRCIVQGGTYIRKLVDDLGNALGSGAHMLELRRTRAGVFEESSKEYPSVNLYDFEEAVEKYKKGDDKLLRKILIPAEIVTEVYPIVKIEAKPVEVDKILHGQPIYKESLIKDKKSSDFKIGDSICIVSNDTFLGMFRVVLEGRVFATPLFVLQPMK